MLGTSEKITPDSADMVLMSGKVPMHILHHELNATVEHIARGLRPGKIVVFESWNPELRAWKHWNAKLTERHTLTGLPRETLITDPPDENGLVVMHCHNEFVGHTRVIDVDIGLKFRSNQQIAEDLQQAGIVVNETYRDWDSQPLQGGHEQPLMAFIATRP